MVRALQKIQMASSEHLVARISLLLKRNVSLRQVIWLTPPKQEKRCRLSGLNQSQQLTANYALFDAKYFVM